MDLFSAIHTAIELIAAVDACSTYPKNLTESMKTFNDKLTSTQGLLVELEELVKDESGNTIPSHSHIVAADSSQSDRTLQLINNRDQLQVLWLTLNDISAWLDTLGSRSKSKKLFSLAQLRPFRDD